MLKKIKVHGDYIFPRCIRRKGKIVCKPKGKTYKFRSYKYIWIDINNKTLEPIKI